MPRKSEIEALTANAPAPAYNRRDRALAKARYPPMHVIIAAFNDTPQQRQTTTKNKEQKKRKFCEVPTHLPVLEPPQEQVEIDAVASLLLGLQTCGQSTKSSAEIASSSTGETTGFVINAAPETSPEMCLQDAPQLHEFATQRYGPNLCLCCKGRGLPPLLKTQLQEARELQQNHLLTTEEYSLLKSRILNLVV